MKYGLKLWSNNNSLFGEAVASPFDFVELYSNPEVAPDYDALTALKKKPITIHATHRGGFHEFLIGEAEMAEWRQTIELADFFNSPVIVVHPGRHGFESFKENLSKLDDPRISIENMAGLDTERKPMFGQKIQDLELIRELKPICFDFEKAVKAACYQKRDYKEYIEEALRKLKPEYFHISGGFSDSPVDEHRDLDEGNFDVTWMKQKVSSVENARLVFETPKGEGIQNDVANMEYFRAL